MESNKDRLGLFEMLADSASHFEHVDRSAAEHFREFFIWTDQPLVLCVLELFRLDIHPKLFDDLGARCLFSSHDLCKGGR